MRSVQAQAADFITENSKSPVVHGTLRQGGGARYTLANGRFFSLSTDVCNALPPAYPRWAQYIGNDPEWDCLTYENALEAVKSEFDYAEKLERHQQRPKSAAEYIALIDHVSAQAKADFYNEAGPMRTAYLRKIAALAVRALMENGAPHREA